MDSNMQSSTPSTGAGSAASGASGASCFEGTYLQRPNSELTQDEKDAKRDLKRLLKRQTRRRKLEIRLSQAISRREHVFAEKARAALDAFLLEEEPGEPRIHPHGGASSDPHKVARDVVESVYHKLQARLQDNTNNDTEKPTAELKVFRTEQARTLLNNMTKGSQTEAMFENEAALRGYTRHKFIERAMLMVTALTKLGNLPESSQSQDYRCHERIRAKLASVRSLCSVGCGPGCDAVGVAGYLSSIEQSSSVSGSTKAKLILDYAVLMDYTVQHWDKILLPLVDIVPPELVGDMVTSFCDARSSLTESNNALAAQLLSRREEVDGTDNDNGNEKYTNSQRLKVDLVVTSYLLSETRGQWHAFFDDLVRRTDPGTIFIFSDPTAWQLHVFMERNSQCMDFCWLDSSMHRPELQALEGRVGPAVLVGMKRE
jgi:hypothetical protein